MRTVTIITDSTCCLPKELVEQYNIRIVPLIINYKGKSYRDGVDMTPSQVYDIMRLKNDLPTTSTAPPGAFIEAYREASHQAENILCITLTGLQSKTYDTALVAKDLVKDELHNVTIEIFDSRSVAGALGFIVLESARAASRGAGLPEVIGIARDVMSKVKLLAMLDTLYYLKRGGRIGKAAAWAGALLQVKPVLEHSPATGETMPIARPRTRTNAIEYMLNLIAQRVKNAEMHVIVHHAGEPEEGEKLKTIIASRFKYSELYLTEFTPIMGVHTGPGLLAISYY